MLKDFISYLESHVNKGIYVWGAQGQLATIAFIKAHESGTNETRALNLYNKRLATVPPSEIYAFDCSGLGMYWLLKNKYYTSDMTANGMYGKCEKLTKDKLKKGDWVFRHNGFRVTHVGYVADDALHVIEDKGRDHGVIEKPLNHWSTTYWNRFGRPLIFKSEIEQGESDVMLKSGDTGEAVKAWQESLQRTGFVGDMNPDHFGEYGPKTESATKLFQAYHTIPQTGVVDNTTMGKMFTSLLSIDDLAQGQIEKLQTNIKNGIVELQK